MAIPFLNNITLNNNEIQNVRLHNTGTSNNAKGQIFFNTGVDLAQYYANAIDQWVSLKEYSFGDGTYISANVTGTAAKPIITPDLSATAVTGNIDATKYLRGDNKWAEISTIPGTYSWEFDGDSGTPQTVLSTDTVTFEGGTKITTLASAGDILKISHDLQTQTDSTSVASPADGATFTVVDSVTRDITGHATGLNVKTITLPSFPTIPTVGNGQIDGRTSGLGLSGSMDATANQGGDTTFTVASNATTAATASTLMYRDSSGYSNVITPASGDSTTKIATTAFVQAALTGLLEFKGGFRADTGQITSGANYTPGAGNETYLWGAARVLVEIGDYYIASGATSGNFYGDATYPLTPGDSVIGVADASANASVVGDWAVVQSDTDLATNSTVGLMTINPVGVGGITSNIVNGIATITNTDTNTSNTFSGLIGNGTLTSLQIPSTTHLLGNDSTSFIIQLVEVSSGETVYADVIRGASGLVTIDFADAPAANAIRVLIQKIG